MDNESKPHDSRLRVVSQILQLLFYLYLFLLSIDLMGSALKLFGSGFAESLIATTSNPFVGLFIGILSTSVIQSSSSTTSIVVGMVGGGALNVANAIPIVMGANIGTSVTNTIVALANLKRSNEFQRSFAASTVHDFFNLLAVLTIFPLQYMTNFLGHASTWFGNNFQDAGGMSLFNPIKAATKPVVELLISIGGAYPWLELLLALILLFVALRQIVSVLRVLVVKRAEAWFDKILFKTPVHAFFVGLAITLMAQSSSITTSLVVPMAGVGILTLIQIFPYTLGANIGTTITAILAALVTGNINAVIVAFAHLFFNITGIVIWWPLAKVPVAMATQLSKLAIRNKLFPFVYILIVFFLIPILVIVLFR